MFNFTPHYEYVVNGNIKGSNNVIGGAWLS